MRYFTTFPYMVLKIAIYGIVKDIRVGELNCIVVIGIWQASNCISVVGFCSHHLQLFYSMYAWTTFIQAMHQLCESVPWIKESPYKISQSRIFHKLCIKYHSMTKRKHGVKYIRIIFNKICFVVFTQNLGQKIVVF